jgi:prepilin-type N-terminal cleavage/methylation domain-containing protein
MRLMYGSMHGMNRSRSRSGFTLLELLIALIIISVVSAIAFPAFFGAVSANDITTMRTDVQRLQFQARSYYDAHSVFPQTPGNGWVTAPIAGLDFRPSPGMEFSLERSADGQGVVVSIEPLAPPHQYCSRRLGTSDIGNGIECVTQ